jgi:hypothetical protein
MSITVRLYSDSELTAIKAGTADKNLITVFLNGKTFSEREIQAYPYGSRRVYVAYFDNQSEPVEFYAVDDESALWFISQEYNRDNLYTVEEVIKAHRVVPIRAPGFDDDGNFRPVDPERISELS